MDPNGGTELGSSWLDEIYLKVESCTECRVTVTSAGY